MKYQRRTSLIVAASYFFCLFVGSLHAGEEDEKLRSEPFATNIRRAEDETGASLAAFKDELAELPNALSESTRELNSNEDDDPYSMAAFQGGEVAPAAGGARPSGSSSSRNSSRFGTAGQSNSMAFNRPTYMIADNPGSGGGASSFKLVDGRDPAGLLALKINLDQPSFSFGRTNISENNSPLVTDRVYFSYRHFQNTTELSLFPNTPQGGSNTLNLDRFTLGAEKKLGDQHSVEFRAPMNSQLNSNLNFSLTPGSTNLPFKDYNNEFGNLTAIFKGNYFRTETFLFAAGAAFTAPTAPDTQVHGLVNYRNLVVRDPSGVNVPLTVDYKLRLDAYLQNQSYILTPFVAYLHAPNSRIFSQGFIQVDVPLNESNARVNFDTRIDAGFAVFDPPPLGAIGKVAPQTILRVDWGTGYWFINEPDAPYLNQMGVMFEVHYTGSLNNAEIFGPVTNLPGVGPYQPVQLSFGNGGNRFDNVNLVAGIPTRIGQTTFTHGFIVPARSGFNRAFDFEYSFFVNRRF